mmetsp:Transcript_3763/g.11818  ORF Transcript_3763/g.11818 Transcript_3763/m.11818 type:complete len:242 (-) Transcript_3763:764-1489(-)
MSADAFTASSSAGRIFTEAWISVLSCVMASSSRPLASSPLIVTISSPFRSPCTRAILLGSTFVTRTTPPISSVKVNPKEEWCDRVMLISCIGLTCTSYAIPSLNFSSYCRGRRCPSELISSRKKKRGLCPSCRRWSTAAIAACDVISGSRGMYVDADSAGEYTFIRCARSASVWVGENGSGLIIEPLVCMESVPESPVGGDTHFPSDADLRTDTALCRRAPIRSDRRRVLTRPVPFGPRSK